MNEREKTERERMNQFLVTPFHILSRTDNYSVPCLCLNGGKLLGGSKVERAAYIIYIYIYPRTATSLCACVRMCVYRMYMCCAVHVYVHVCVY